MKHVKLFEAFINESSTLSTIGATPAQVSAIHKSKFNESKVLAMRLASFTGLSRTPLS